MNEAGESERREELLLLAMLQNFVKVYGGLGYAVHGVKGLEGYSSPPAIRNRGFGSGRAKTPDIVGLDPEHKRIVFGVIRPDRQSLDTEESLEEYNVFLDHNEERGSGASLLMVQMPAGLVGEFTAIITHYIHREYWHRVVPVSFPDSNQFM